MLSKLNRYILSLLLVLALGFCGIAPVNQQLPSPAITEQLETYNCFYAVVLHEAAGEPLKGKRAVADTVINRLRHKNYPNSVCSVVTQPKQFSGINRTLSVLPRNLYNASKPSINTQIAHVSYEAMQKVLRGSKTDIPALFYHNISVKPRWSKYRKLLTVVGNHKFYI